MNHKFGENQLEELSPFFQKHNIILTALIMAVTTLLALFLHFFHLGNDSNIALMYSLAIVLTARWTN